MSFVVWSADCTTLSVIFGLDSGGLPADRGALWRKQVMSRSGDRRGAGLGLAIARGIAEAHSGRLWLESEVGHGTKAWLQLPLAG